MTIGELYHASTIAAVAKIARPRWLYRAILARSGRFAALSPNAALIGLIRIAVDPQAGAML